MSETTRRVIAVDIARGLAVLAMFAFHFIWDLGHFGHIDADFPYSPGVKAFGHAIAASFLFIAGASLALAHERGVRWPGFWRRLAIVTAAAALVSAATYLAFPNAFVFFGILHCIAVSSLVALPFLLWPWPAALAAASIAVLAPFVAREAIFDAPQWWWTGLSTFEPATNDYRPLIPWAGALLAGVAATKVFRSLSPARGASPTEAGAGSASETRKKQKAGVFPCLDETRKDSSAPSTRPGGATAGLVFLGRHSLILYLAHQPLLFAGFTAAALLIRQPPETERFEDACRAQCVASGALEQTCRAACACTTREVVRQDALAGVMDETERGARIAAIARACMGGGK